MSSADSEIFNIFLHVLQTLWPVVLFVVLLDVGVKLLKYFLGEGSYRQSNNDSMQFRNSIDLKQENKPKINLTKKEGNCHGCQNYRPIN